ILHITVAEGQTVAIGSRVGRIEERAGSEDGAKSRDGKRSTAEAGQTAAAPAARMEKAPTAAPALAVSRQEEQHLSPEVRRLVREKGIDTQQLKGTGPRGRVIKEDVLGLASLT